MYTCTHIPLCIGGILAGGISDIIKGRAITCTAMMYLSVPAVSTCTTIVISYSFSYNSNNHMHS